MIIEVCHFCYVMAARGHINRLFTDTNTLVFLCTDCRIAQLLLQIEYNNAGFLTAFREASLMLLQ